MTPLSVNVPNFGPEADAESLLGWARFVEDSGFATLLVSDHVVPTREITELYPDPFFDPFTLLAWLAGQTRRIALGISVLIVPYRHPLLTARMSAAVHHLSGGRFVLGVGAGWAASEFAAVGQDFSARGPTTDRYLRVITQAWSQDQVSYHDAIMHFEAATGPRPTARPIPLWIGGSGSAALRRAVELGASWHPVNPELGWLRDVGLPDLARQAQAAKRPVPPFVPRIKARVCHEPVTGRRPLGVGTVEQIVSDVRKLADLGAAEIVLDPNPDRPRPRDFALEQQQLGEIHAAYDTRATHT
jgi:probable F420-dependent oxidoreductase